MDDVSFLQNYDKFENNLIIFAGYVTVLQYGDKKINGKECANNHGPY